MIVRPATVSLGIAAALRGIGPDGLPWGRPSAGRRRRATPDPRDGPDEPTLGAPRMHGEVLKLGFDVSGDLPTDATSADAIGSSDVGTRPEPIQRASCTSPRSPTAVAGRWPDVLSNAVDRGWVPTKMGGPGAPDDFEMDVSPRPGSRSAMIRLLSSAADCWHHRRPQVRAREVSDTRFQNELSATLAELTGVTLF
jgi:hypothetical protein